MLCGEFEPSDDSNDTFYKKYNEINYVIEELALWNIRYETQEQNSNRKIQSNGYYVSSAH